MGGPAVDRKHATSTTTNQQEAAPSHGLIARLLRTWGAPVLLRVRGQPTADLRPAGSRSGHGSGSIEPYLSQGRSTRPGDLT